MQMDKEPQSTPSSQKPVSSLGKLTGLLRDRWPEYVLEIFVIIFSITISFAVDEWKDKQRKQDLEQQYLMGLQSDIETDLNQLQEVIHETQQVIGKAKELSAVSQRTSVPDYTRFIQNMRFVFKRPRFIAEDATFSDLKSTGNLQVISSFTLKNSLFDYYKQYENTVLVENAEAETTNTIIGPYLLKHFSFGGGKFNNPPVNWTAITGEAEFQNSIEIRRSTREELLRDYLKLLAQGKQIRLIIKPKLK